jgi:hypothetical protein
MENKFIKVAFCGLVLSASGFSNAAIIHGNLEFDETNSLILDDMNSRTWLSFDTLTGSSITDLLSSLASGGAYEDYQVASFVDAILFVDAFLGTTTHPCSSITSNTVCETNYSYTDGDFGDNWNTGYDYAIFNSITTGVNDYGWIEFAVTGSRLTVQPDWTPVENVNTFFQGGPSFNQGGTMGFLAWKDGVERSNNKNSIPEPSTLAIFALGLMGLASSRFKKQA